MKHIKTFESSSRSFWYYGLADCNGLESFIFDPTEEDEFMDVFVEKGFDEKKSSAMYAMAMRAFANQQRKAVAFQVKISEENAEAIEQMMNAGEYIEALEHLKETAESVKLAVFGFGKAAAKSNWDWIPNPKLDPYGNSQND